MAEQQSKVRVKASPRGKRCGLFHYANETLAVTVLVLPKVWSSPPDRARTRLSGDNKSLTLVLYELEVVTLELAREWVTFLVNDVQISIDEAVEAKLDKLKEAKRARLARKGTSTGPAPVSEGHIADGVAEDLDSEVELEDAVLNELVHFSPAKLATATELLPSDEEDGTSHAGEGLLALMQLAEKCDPYQDPWVHEADTTAGPGGVIGDDGTVTKDQLGILLQWLFVELMRARIRKVRRGYVAVTETSPTIRGRMTARGMVQHIASGVPEIECAHDEFTEATVLFRVLATALEVVASGNLASLHGLGEWSIAQRLARDALHLRRQLMAIPSLPVAVAAELVSTIRLTRLQREWERPLTVARRILRAEPPRLSSTQDGSHAVQWWLDTSRLWERVVEQGFKKLGWEFASQGKGERAGDGFRVWGDLGGAKRPDTTAWKTEAERPTRKVLVDAKYKLGATSGTVTAADQYQIFTYSLLAPVGQHGPADTVALLYPSPPSEMDPEPAKQSFDRTTFQVAARVPGGTVVSDAPPVTLHVALLPYPSQEELEDWGAFMDRFAKRLNTLLAPEQANAATPPPQTHSPSAPPPPALPSPPTPARPAAPPPRSAPPGTPP